MRAFAELRQFAQHNVEETKNQLKDVASIVILWNKNIPITPVAIAGEVESYRDIPRLLREIADKLEKDKGKQITTV